MTDTDTMITVELNVDRTPTRFTAEQFALMTKGGIVARTDSGRELVRGVPHGVQARFAPHARDARELAFLLDCVFGNEGEFCLHRGGRVRLSQTHVIEPDLVIVRCDDARSGDVPAAAAVVLAIVIGARSDASEADYAAAGVAALWIIDAASSTVNVFERPARGGYAGHRAVRFGAPIALAPLANAEIVIPEGSFA